MYYKLSAPLRFAFFSGFLIIFLFTGCQPEESPILISPAEGQNIVTNTPVLAWTPIACDWQEVWINGIKMDSIEAGVNTYVPFALSYGINDWQIVAVKGNNRICSHHGSFNIDDQPLAILPNESQLLRQGWLVRSAARTEAGGKQLSSGEISLKGWYSTSLPATALTVLVRNGVYPNPYIGKNNMEIPDLNDDFNKKYSLLKYSHIKGQNPWKKPYWYVKSFVPDLKYENKRMWLNINELNYCAELWLNGRMLADTSRMVGMERQFRFDITDFVKKDQENHLAIAVYPVDFPGEPGVPPVKPFGDPGVNMGDGTIGKNYTKWDAVGWDWQPAVRDRDMGITEDVFLSFTDDIELTNVYITSEPHLPEADFADMMISADLLNYSANPKKGTITGEIMYDNDTLLFRVPFALSGGGTKSFKLDKDEVSQLRIRQPHLWWPVGYGEPDLYKIKLVAQTESGDVSVVEKNHGIRKIESRIKGSRIFTINGKDIFLKGGNWVIDMTLNWTASRYKEEILLTKNANLNVLRVWGPTGIPPESFFESADKQGILIWQDFLNDYWGTFKNTLGYQPDKDLFRIISTGIVKRCRNHAALFLWCGGNEGVNPREELLVKDILANYDNRSGRFYLKSSNGDGLHGGGPYHSIRPEAFFTHPNLHGFSSEIGASGVPVIESIRWFIPGVGKETGNDHFPVDGTWAYHDAANFPGQDLRKFTALDDIIRKDYGGPETRDQEGVKNYFAKAQFQNYAAYQAAASAIGIQMWHNSTGMLLWKSNSSWPSLVWQLYDWYEQAHAGYYGAKKAFAPFSLQYDRAKRSIYVVNARYKSFEDVLLSAVLYNKSMNVLWKSNQIINITENSVYQMKDLVPEKEELVFLKLEARDKNGNLLADNLYWLHKGNDFSELTKMTEPLLDVKMTEGNQRGEFTVSVKNEDKRPAFFIRLKIVDRISRHEILPALWSDNFISLLPGEKKELTVTFPRGKYPGDVDIVENR